MSDKLPKGWARTTLGELTLPSGTRISPSEEPDLPYVGMEHVEPQTMKLLGHGEARSLRSLSVRFSKDDVLYGKMRPYLNKVWLAQFNGLCSAEFLVFPKTEGVNNQLLAYRLNSQDFVNFANQQVSGDRPRVGFDKLSSFPVLLPPSQEQDRIVAKLDALLSRVAAGERAARRALDRLERYRASVLHAGVTGELTREWRKTHPLKETGVQVLKRLLAERRARWEEDELNRLRAAGTTPKDDKWKRRYPDPAELDRAGLPELPAGWVWVALRQLGFIIGGLTKNPRRATFRNKLPYLRVGNVYANELRLDDVKTVGVEKEELDKLLLKEGDLLIVEGNGSKDQIGRLALWDNSIEPCVHQNHLIKVRLVQKGLGRWILSWLLSSAGRHHVETGASSTTGLYTLSVSKVGNLPIPLPPNPERVEIVRQVERRLAAADRLTTTLKLQLERAQITRQSLLRKAFAGKLIPQDSEDEPASVLLEHVRAARKRESAGREFNRKRRTRSATKPKEAGDMTKQAPTINDLQKAWQSIGKKLDARSLFDTAGFALDQVTLFYELLRSSSEIVDAFKAKGTSRRKAAKVLSAKPKSGEGKPGRFRLTSLWLEDFKNLKDYEVRFDATHGLDIVLGWNGTGKSNLFEALVIIFRDLHYWQEKNKWPEERMAGYRLHYEIENRNVQVIWDPSRMKRPEITEAAISNHEEAELNVQQVKRENVPLPRFVFGYYSGPTNRLADHFWPMKRDHYERLRKANSDAPEALAKLLEQRRFFCAEASHAKYVLLAFSYKEDPQIWRFLEDRLRIVGFESALFVIRKPRWAKGKPEEFWGATGIMRRVMEKLKRYAVAPMVLKQKVADAYRLPSEELYYFFLPDLKSLHAFAAEYADARSFFLALESTDFSELIYDLKIQVRVKAANNQETSVTFRELSEGEQQLLMVLGLMRFTKSHQSLILLDEPDTHLNPHWSVQYLKDLASVVGDDNAPSPEQQTSQLLMATHDPLVIASLIKDQIHLLKRDPETLSCYWELASVNPKGLGFTGILTSEMFGFRSDLDPDTLADLDDRVRLTARKGLSGPEKKQLEEIDKRLAEAGFLKAFSDPYYAAFVRAWGRRYAEQMSGKEVLTKKDAQEIDRIAKEVLAEAAAEVEREVG